MGYNLFLDDLRRPKDAYISSACPSKKGLIEDLTSLEKKSGIDNNDWVIVRSYKEFVDVVEERGLPDAVSFDHDLDYEHIKHYYNVTKDTGVIEYGNLKIKTGKHCATFLIDKCRELSPEKLPKFYVHSANYQGSVEIRKELGKL